MSLDYRLATTALALAASLCISSAGAREAPVSDLTACDRLAFDPDTSLARSGPLELPEDWAAFSRSTVHWLAFATEVGGTHCSDIGWFEDTRDFTQFHDRFAGFEWFGYEAFGYMLIDRSGDGQEVDTGAKPVFSPAAARFATVQRSGSGWGGFEGFAVYSVHPRGFSPEHLEFDLPDLEDWRIDRWVGDGCIVLSAVPLERLEGNYDRLQTVQRDEYVSKAENRWKLLPGNTC